MYMGYFDLLMFKIMLGSFSVFVSKWPVTQKRLTMSGINWNLGLCLAVACIWGSFDLSAFKNVRMFWVIRCTCLKMPLTQKRLAVEQKKKKKVQTDQAESRGLWPLFSALTLWSMRNYETCNILKGMVVEQKVSKLFGEQVLSVTGYFWHLNV